MTEHFKILFHEFSEKQKTIFPTVTAFFLCYKFMQNPSCALNYSVE
jgi:hypothetical protein